MRHFVTPVHIRAMRPEDIAAGLRLCRASHWNQVARDWELFLALSPDGCRVATDENGDVIGSVATLRYQRTFSWIAMALVHPSHRGGGIGTRLLEEALAMLSDEPTVRLDATPAGFGIYARAGFREEYRLQRMQRAAAALEIGPGARPMQDSDLQDVLKQDRDVFGADRQVLLHAFRHDAPEYAWVAGGSELEGYLFGRRGYAFEHLGPLVARDEATARRLAGACLAAHPDRAFILDVPLHSSWLDWLQSVQFTVQRPFVRMARGRAWHGERPDHMFAIVGPEFG